MTKAERADPELIDASRRSRIAAGSGTNPSQVAMLVKQFNEMQKMMKRMGGLGSKRMKKKAKKAKKGKGSRVTAKKQQRTPAPAGLALPGLQESGLDLSALGDVDDLPELK